MQPVKLSFGIKKAGLAKAAPKKAGSSVFAAGDDDEEEQPVPSTSKLTAAGNKPRVSTASLSKAQKAKQAADLLLDSTVYEYDEVFDQMKEGSRLAELEKKKESGERKVSWLHNCDENLNADPLDSPSTSQSSWRRPKSGSGIDCARRTRWCSERGRRKARSLPIRMHSSHRPTWLSRKSSGRSRRKRRRKRVSPRRSLRSPSSPN